MKKLALTLALALSLASSAFAAGDLHIGVRGNLSGTNGYQAIVVGLDKINTEFLVGAESISAVSNKDAAVDLQSSSVVFLGAVYNIAKVGATKVGVIGTLFQADTAQGNPSPSGLYAKGTDKEKWTVLDLGLDANAEIVSGLSLGVSTIFVETIGTTAKTGYAFTEVGAVKTQVYLQALWF